MIQWNCFEDRFIAASKETACLPKVFSFMMAITSTNALSKESLLLRRCSFLTLSTTVVVIPGIQMLKLMWSGKFYFWFMWYMLKGSDAYYGHLDPGLNGIGPAASQKDERRNDARLVTHKWVEIGVHHRLYFCKMTYPLWRSPLSPSPCEWRLVSQAQWAYYLSCSDLKLLC